MLKRELTASVAGYRREHLYFIVALCLLVAFAAVVEWNGYYSTIGMDGFHYVRAGVSLLSSGQYVNPSGKPEVWFPPVYPILIGIGSLGGRLNPHATARIISVAFAIALVPLLWSAAYKCTRSKTAATIAAAILTLNPTFLNYSTASLSEIIATVFLTCALLVWLRADPSPKSGFLLGLFSAFAYLTRPEAVLPLAVWCLYDLATRQRPLKTLLWTGLAFLICVLPYNVFLYRTTGHLFSNKSEVNLAGGRGTYYGWAREWIDPDALTMSYFTPPHPVTLKQEIGRYLAKSKELRYLYTSLVGGTHRAAAALTLIACALALFLALQGRARAGVFSLLLYLAVLPGYSLKDRYLLESLPAMAILCGAAVAMRWGKPWLRIGLGTAALAGLVMNLAALPPQFMPHTGSRLQQRAGLVLLDAPSNAVLLEGVSRVAYYAHRDRQQRTVQPLDLNVRYACKTYPGRQLYVVSLASANEKPPVTKLSVPMIFTEGKDTLTITPITADCSW
ncbi:MAG: glycosyltransferase family 39 protein [Candidatus Solibacter sp.]